MKDRLDYLNSVIASLEYWDKLEKEIDLEISALTVRLIAENNEQTRGAIKALQKLKDLPAALEYERREISAALSEQDAAT